MKRCKVGDLAIIIKSSFSENIGMVVEVDKPARAVGDWWVESRRPMMTSWLERLTRATCADEHLLPIRPQHDEAEETELERVE